MFDRWNASTLQEKLERPYVHLIFGARQTGKSTLLRSLVPPPMVEHPAEPPPLPHAGSPLPFAWIKGGTHAIPFPTSDLFTRLTFGELPGVVAAPKADRTELLPWFCL